MKTIARIITRPSEDCKPNLGLVFFMKGNTELLANRIYEIQNYDGELIIKDVGECGLGNTISESHPKLQGCWGNEIGWLLECVGKKLCLTRKELDELR